MPTLRSLLEHAFPGNSSLIIDQLDPAISAKLDIEPEPLPPAKTLNLYTTYPDAFEENGQRNLATLTNKLSYIKTLGCNAVHILPFFASPMIDGGFDVQDFLSVRSDLGGLEAFDALLAQARELELEVFIDLACNHVSQTHPWFELATQGNQTYRDYFIHSQAKPKLIAYENSVAHYEVWDKHISAVAIFPDQAGELPHWTQGADGYWYFHTFYPHQLDLNWSNPQIFVEIAAVIAFWVQRGVNFRLDAAPHLDKHFEGFVEKNTPRNLEVIQALRLLIHHLDPHRSLLVEVVDSPDHIKSYFATDQHLGAEYAYNLVTLNGLWAALLLQDASHLTQSLQTQALASPQSQWIHFLRSHDALMLGFIDEPAPRQLHHILEPLGQSFGKGIEVAGRLSSFLEANEEKIILAHFLLASLPGSIAIMYGDEVGKNNDAEFVTAEFARKQQLFNDPRITQDARDLGRGVIYTAEYFSPRGQYIFHSIKAVLEKRLTLPLSGSAQCEVLSLPAPALFGLRYHNPETEVLILANLGEQVQSVEHEPDWVEIVTINQVLVENAQIMLPSFSGIWLEKKR